MWLDSLTLEQKDLLLECFSIGLCLGAKSLDEYYTFYEGCLSNPHISDVNLDKIKQIREAMVALLPLTGPGFEDVDTPDKFLDMLNKSYSLPQSERKEKVLNDSVEQNKRFRETEAFKFNYNVMVDRTILNNYRSMLNFSHGGKDAKNNLNHWRFLLASFAEKPYTDQYLKDEILMEDWEIEEVKLWKNLRERSNEGHEDEDYYNPEDYIDKGEYEGMGLI